MSQRFVEIAKYSGLKRVSGLTGYFREQIFRDVSVRGSRVVDIGGGNGLVSFWCATDGGAMTAAVLEPFADGSHGAMSSQFDAMREKAGRAARAVRMVKTDLEMSPNDLWPADIVVMHNVINHIDESATRCLHESDSAQAVFREYFTKIAQRLTSGGTFIVADCSSKNWSVSLGVKNPLAPTIEWDLHQPPSVWIELIEQSGFRHKRTIWTSRRELGWLGRKMLGNAFGAYLTTSHFALHFERS